MFWVKCGKAEKDIFKCIRVHVLGHSVWDNILLPSLPHVSQNFTFVVLIHNQKEKKKAFIPLNVIY